MVTIGIVNSMQRRTPAQVIETFHLAFLLALCARPSEWFVLKGGANLRYFFGSPRYSNDIDLDFTARPAWGVARAVESVLNGAALSQLTRATQIDIVEWSAHKQTPTTLRWKVGVRAIATTEVLRTKIEFSGRSSHVTDDWLFQSVPESLVRPYALRAPALRRYGATSAINQKIAALALRSETKARDVFDLELLLRQRRAENGPFGTLDTTHAKTAAERALEITYASFMSEVAPFLDDVLLQLYDARTWEVMCRDVSTWLNELDVEKPRGGHHS